MPSRAFASISVVLTAMLLVAGCGSSNNKSSTTGGTSSSTSGGASGSATQSVPSGAADRAARACKQSIDRTGQLSADVKKSLEKTCDKAAHGDQNAARQATEQVCVKIAEQAIPAGSARDQAVAACKRTAP